MRPVLLLLALALFAPVAAAKTISINISQSAAYRDGNLAVTVKVGNSGDEAAQSVTPILRFKDQELRGKGKASLDPNTSFEEVLTLPVGQLGDGRWPYRLAVDYTDLNQYPFQALQTQVLVIGNPPPAKVAVPAIKADGIAGSGTLNVQLKNLTATPRTATMSVLVPDGLEVTDARRDTELPAWADQTVAVPVVNRTALAGSRYPVFVAVEYEDGPVHQALVAQGIVEILAPQTAVQSWSPMLLWGAGGLVALWLGFMLLRLFRRPADSRA